MSTEIVIALAVITPSIAAIGIILTTKTPNLRETITLLSGAILFAFICFRIFDIYKIYPVNLGEKMKGAVGVIADDVIAGIYTIIFLMIYRIILY